VGVSPVVVFLEGCTSKTALSWGLKFCMCSLYMNRLQHDFSSQIREGHQKPLVEFI